MSDDSGTPSAERFEGLGTFYLGRLRDAGGEPFLYDANDLTTHAVALGMTGSGKTGLCITLIEEAALDGVPSIALDLKGDIANLMLTFPNLAPADFRPWIDEAEATREGRTPDEHAASRPMVPPKVEQLYLDGAVDGPYRPALLGQAELHYTDRGADLDHWTEVHCLADISSGIPSDPWDGAMALDEPPPVVDGPADGAGYATLPAGAADPSAYGPFEKRFKSWLYRERRLRLRSCGRLGLVSRPGEPEAEFELRLRDAAREARDAAVEQVRKQFATKVGRLESRIATAAERVERETAEYEQHRDQSFVRLGTSVLGALLGRKTISKTNLGKLSTAANSFGRASKHRDDVGRAQSKREDLEAELAALEAEMNDELAAVREAWAPDALDVEEVEIAPRKSDITVKRVALAWVRGGRAGIGGPADGA